MPKAARIGGQRRYAADAVHRLAVLQVAQSCGFRLDEMRHLLHGFGPGVKPAQGWQGLARKKQQELDDQIARLKAMRRLVDRVFLCDCLELSECGRIAASAMELASHLVVTASGFGVRGEHAPGQVGHRRRDRMFSRRGA